MSKQILKRRIKATGQIQKVTRAMSSVAGRKLSIVDIKRKNANTYWENILNTLSTLPKSTLSTRYFQKGESTNNLYIIVSTDKGLVGSLNREIGQFIKNQQADNVQFFLVGTRALEFIGSRTKIIDTYTNIGDYPEPEAIAPLSDLILSMFLDNKVSSIYIIYADFISQTKHNIIKTKILPLETNIINNTEKYHFDLEPNEMIKTVVKNYVISTIYKAIINAKAVEHSSRVIAMQTASDNAHEMKENLLRKSFKENQQAITSEIADTLGAKFALQI